MGLGSGKIRTGENGSLGGALCEERQEVVWFL
jgi:hypothetical protein